MNALAEIKSRFSLPLSEYVDDPHDLLGMIRPAGDPKFGDYQANCAMSLGNKLGKPPREVASDLVGKISINDLCQNVEIAGPGFINLTLDDDWLKRRLDTAIRDERLGIEKTANPLKFVVDFSSPNVAKPMHVGHIRSTVIGDALAKILSFVGHDVITDNHVGDWGTQFGMIIYGYKHFLDETVYENSPVVELGRLYKYVRRLMDYQGAVKNLPATEELLAAQQAAAAKLKQQPETGDKKADKKTRKDISALESKIGDQTETIQGLKAIITAIENDAQLKQDATTHNDIHNVVLRETAALHEGDKTNLRLWNEFLPHCREDIQRIYNRLSIEFDYEHGESFFQDQLSTVVDDFEAKGFARTSEGAICVFMDGYDTPMIIKKKDGAFLYATSDLATIKYRIQNWQADAILYVVDHRQHQHFEKLFDAARLWGYADTELTHVSFGTVLGEDGKPYKTRSGETVGLEGLLDEAESRALAIATEQNSELTASEQQQISTVIGIGALKYADLSQNRASDYKFSYDKMLALKGNTATYLQYSYARVQGIIRKLDANVEELRTHPVPIEFEKDVERQLGVRLIRFGEALDEVLLEYKPNILCNYLFELTQTFFQFYDQCSVKDADTESLRLSRLQQCDLTARTIKTGLSLLGIGVLDQM
jgi:arginyl-tRNA synthetase